MTLDLTPPADQAWLDPARYWGELATATADLDTPFGVIALPALAHNAHDMLRRANGTTIRVASKSVRVRGVLDAVLALPGYAGVLAYTLPEALWLAERIEDVVVGYPSVDRAAISTLGTDPRLAARVTLMVDSIAQLDLVDAVLPPARARAHPGRDRARRLVAFQGARPPRRVPLARAHRRPRPARSRRPSSPAPGSGWSA